MEPSFAATLLPPVLIAVVGLSLLAYVLLDGHDLGVGMLLPLASTSEQDTLVASVSAVWDGNEAWLLLASAVLVAGFSAARDMVLPALSVPLTLLLASMAVRCAALGLRSGMPGRHRWLAAGSLLASMTQGWVLGAYVTGFQQDTWALLFSAGIALTLPAAYAMLGIGWLIMRTEGSLQHKAMRWGQGALWPMGFALMGISLATPVLSRTVFDKWFALPQLLLLLPIPLACLAALLAIRHVLASPRAVRNGHGWIVFAATVAIFVLAFGGLAYSLYPFIAIDRLTVWQAASPLGTLVATGIGAAVALPVILAFTLSRYRAAWRAQRCGPARL